jgi:hypothetical protein
VTRAFEEAGLVDVLVCNHGMFASRELGDGGGGISS